MRETPCLFGVSSSPPPSSFFLFPQLTSHHTCRYTLDSCFHLPDHLPDQLLVVVLLLLLRRDLTELRDDEEVLLLLRKGLLRHRPHM